MCGIFGVIASGGRQPSLSDAQVERCRDTMAHRGPDGAGLWRSGAAALAHRRLAVRDRTPAGAQPMLTSDGRFALVYNGELYNDADLRDALAREGARFRSRSDAETALLAFERWGAGALRRFRGMFALALWDSRERRLLLARDPLGVKPLYYGAAALPGGSEEIVFASEPMAILAHPRMGARPNLAMISAYCTTIRSVLGDQTMFDGVFAVEPGEAIEFDVRGETIGVCRERFWAAATIDEGIDEARGAALTREAITESVRAHLPADVPVCALLSGGLDSTIVAAIASESIPALETFCAGAAEAMEDEAGDLAAARRVADALGVRHAQTLVTRESFSRDWQMMIERLGAPLSTPNEVAIHAVARALRSAGCVVALSGEGADELFGGYEAALTASMAHVESRRRNPAGTLTPGAFELRGAAWMDPDAKGSILKPDVWRAVEGDAWLHEHYERTLESCCERAGADSAGARLRACRTINLTGLLQRLDTATMLAGVEGRTPFADARVAEVAESLPMACRFAPEEDCGARGAEGALGSRGAAAATIALPRTKRCLRCAFAERLPAEAIHRAKASFPLPFQAWLADQGDALRASAFARAVFAPKVIDAVAADPAGAWRLAWPMLNIAHWGDRWWG